VYRVRLSGPLVGGADAFGSAERIAALVSPIGGRNGGCDGSFGSITFPP
jgi:hypothetical protein